MAEEDTVLANIEQPPLNTTMMGVLKGVADYHGLKLSDPMLFGLTGHAFLINMHVELCPSGPYCWKREFAEPLITNMGLKMTYLGFFGTGTGEEARAEIEQTLREALDRGVPCSLLNMEYQIIYGYDATGLHTTQPWPGGIPERLTFGTWQEFGDSFHAVFDTIEKVEPIDRRDAILASLDYAIDMFRHPEKYSTEHYGVGPLAYDNWIAAVPVSGASHGNWWNATVWSECRQMAAAYFLEIGEQNKDVADQCTQLNQAYKEIADNLQKASEKTMEPEAKIALLTETKQMEEAAIEDVEKLAAALRVSP